MFPDYLDQCYIKKQEDEWFTEISRIATRICEKLPFFAGLTAAAVASKEADPVGVVDWPVTLLMRSGCADAKDSRSIAFTVT